MGELLDYFKDRYSKADSRSAMQDSIIKQKVKNSINSLCEKYLQKAGQEFTFEVGDKDLPYALAVIDEEPLKSRYTIVQVGQNLLMASLGDIDAEDIFN